MSTFRRPCSSSTLRRRKGKKKSLLLKIQISSDLMEFLFSRAPWFTCGTDQALGFYNSVFVQYYPLQFCGFVNRKFEYILFWCLDVFNQLVSSIRFSSLLENCLAAPLGEWSEWSACLRDGVACGFRWGKQTRTRGAGQPGGTPEDKTASLCPPHSETQRCRMKKKCPKGEKGRREGNYTQ